MYIRNKRREIWSPWGTSEETGKELDKKLPYLKIEWIQSDKNDNNQERRELCITFFQNFWN